MAALISPLCHLSLLGLTELDIKGPVFGWGFLFFNRGLHGFHGFCFEAVFFDNLCVLRIEGLLKRALSALLLAHRCYASFIKVIFARRRARSR